MWAPIMAMAPALIVAAIIPFGAAALLGPADARRSPTASARSRSRLQIARLDIGLLFYFAISSLAVYGATLAGWASHNKWAMMGGLRASSQMMSYEVTMGMAVLGAFLVYGTLEPGAIVGRSRPASISFDNFASSWGIFTQPLGFVLFLTAAIAETKRTPFDIPEGEPEIIGYFVEYSGMRFGLFFLGEFLEIVTSSAIMITLFFGGWHWGAHHRRLPARRTCRTSLFVLVMFAALDRQGLRLLHVPAADPLVAAALPLRSADAARLAAPAADLDRQRGRRPRSSFSGRRVEAKENAMAVGVKVVNRPGSLSQQMYLPAIAEGLGVTFRHFVKNFFGNVTGNRKQDRHRDHRVPGGEEGVPGAHRGLHRLMLREDGQVRCVACMMCPTVCPAHCITIVPEEAPDGRIEKRPKIFEIDELRCVVCGLCAEACPCDAIRMDTLEHAKPTYRRVDAILDKEELMSRGTASSAVQGGVGAILARKGRAARRRRRPPATSRRSARPPARRRSPI